MKSSKFASEKIIKQFLIITVHFGPVLHCVAGAQQQQCARPSCSRARPSCYSSTRPASSSSAWRSRRLPCAQATTWAWARIPLARLGSIRPGATLAINLDPTVELHFREAKNPRPGRTPPNPRSICTLAFYLSLRRSLFSHQYRSSSHRVTRAGKTAERAAMAPSPPPLPACVLPSG